MAADHVAVLRARPRADDRPAGACVGGAPVDREGGLAARLRMGGEADVVGTVRAAHDQTPKKPTARRSDGPWLVALPMRNTGGASSIQHIAAGSRDRQVNRAARGGAARGQIPVIPQPGSACPSATPPHWRTSPLSQ